MNNERIKSLLGQIVAFWNVSLPNEELSLIITGGSAVLLHHQGRLATKDIDILVASNRMEILSERLARFMKNGDGVRSDDPYLYIVLDAFAAMPRRYESRLTIHRQDGRASIMRLHSIDLILSKITRFGPKDRRDIETVLDHAEDEIESDQLQRIFNEEQFTFEPDRAESLAPRVEAIVRYFAGEIDSLE